MLVFIVVLVVVALVFETVSLRDPTDGIRYSTFAGKGLLEPGEDFDLVSVFQNRSRLPLPYISVSENLPVQITVNTESVNTSVIRLDTIRGGEPSMLIRSTVYLMPKQSLERRIPAAISERGRYVMRGAVITTGDFFGLRENIIHCDRFSEIVVIPERAENVPEITALGNFLGNISVRRFIMEDPLLTLGFHEYTGAEPQKDISWVQSARLGKIMVKKYDHTLEPSVTILLNVDCGGDAQDYSLLESCYSMARSVCELMEEQQIQYGFITNAVAPGAAGHWPVIRDGLGSVHLRAILEGLGRASYEKRGAFSRIVDLAIAQAENGRSHVIITPYDNEGLRAAANRLRRLTGGETVVLAAGAVEG